MSLEEWKAMKNQEKSDIFKLLDQATLDLAEVPGCFLRYLDIQARMNRYTRKDLLNDFMGIGSIRTKRIKQCLAEHGLSLANSRKTKTDNVA